MTEEIKEILDRLDFNEWEVDLYKVPITWSELYDIRNYITNLQKENENLKEENKRIFSRVNDDELLISNAMNYAELQDYKQRNEKAVEYIGKYLQEHIIDDLPDEESKFELENGTPIPNAKEILLNILEGGDE